MPGLLPYRFLFRFAFPVPYVRELPRTGKMLLALAPGCRLPDPGPLEQAESFGDIRLAWNEKGLGISVEVRGRSGRLQCNPRAPETGDGLQVWIDTRATQTIHRASRFCHHFCLLPAGGGKNSSQPVAAQLPIARAKEPTPLCNPEDLRLSVDVTRQGYLLEAWLPAQALNGYDPEAQPRLGFYCLLRDSSLGEQYLTVGPEFPFAYDPSLWSVLELVRPVAGSKAPRAGPRRR